MVLNAQHVVRCAAPPPKLGQSSLVSVANFGEVGGMNFPTFPTSDFRVPQVPDFHLLQLRNLKSWMWFFEPRVLHSLGPCRSV